MIRKNEKTTTTKTLATGGEIFTARCIFCHCPRAGAVDTGGSNQRSIRFAGRGLDDNNFTYDATNIVNQAQQPFVRLAIPTEAIEEFRIDTMLFTAEDGSTPGGQIAVVSRIGTNELHGSLFEYLRNDIFDAHSPLGNAVQRH